MRKERWQAEDGGTDFTDLPMLRVRLLLMGWIGSAKRHWLQLPAWLACCVVCAVRSFAGSPAAALLMLVGFFREPSSSSSDFFHSTASSPPRSPILLFFFLAPPPPPPITAAAGQSGKEEERAQQQKKRDGWRGRKGRGMLAAAAGGERVPTSTAATASLPHPSIHRPSLPSSSSSSALHPPQQGQQQQQPFSQSSSSFPFIPSPNQLAVGERSSERADTNHHTIANLASHPSILRQFWGSETMNASCPSPGAPSSKAVLVDSLLCFLHNFRDQPQLQSIVLRHFSPATIRHSHQKLLMCCEEDNNNQPNCFGGMLNGSTATIPGEMLLRDLLARLDRICASGQAPVFAAADLLSLPFRPLYGSDGAQLEEEMRQMRFLIQDCLLLRRETSPALHHFSSAVSLPSAPPPHLLSNNNNNSNAIRSPNVTSSPECPPTRPAQPSSTPAISSSSQLASAPTSHQPATDCCSFGQSPSKGLRISQVLEKLSRGNKDTDSEVNSNNTNDNTIENVNENANDEVDCRLATVEEEIAGQRQPQQEQLITTTTTNTTTFPQPMMVGLPMASGGGPTFAPLSWPLQMLRQLAMDSLRSQAAAAVGHFAVAGMNGNALSLMEPLREGHRTPAAAADGKASPADESDQRMEEGEREEEEQNQVDDDNNDEEGGEERMAEEEEERKDDEDVVIEAKVVGFDGSPAALLPLDGDASSGRETAELDEEEAGGEHKPYCCSWPNCQKRFANKFLLKKHQFIHSGQKPHVCQFCKKSFNRKDNLLRHKKTHLQNGMNPVNGAKRRHNMLRGISENEALEMQLLPLSCREGRHQKNGTGGGGAGRPRNRRERQNSRANADEIQQ